MKKTKLKTIVDICMFSCFSTIAFTGLLMWLVIPTGQSGNPYFMGIHRHSWGDIHLFFSVIFLLLAIFHTYLNWNQATAMIKKLLGDNKKIFLYIGLSFVPLTLISWIVKLITE